MHYSFKSTSSIRAAGTFVVVGRMKVKVDNVAPILLWTLQMPFWGVSSCPDKRNRLRFTGSDFPVQKNGFVAFRRRKPHKDFWYLMESTTDLILLPPAYLGWLLVHFKVTRLIHFPCSYSHARQFSLHLCNLFLPVFPLSLMFNQSTRQSSLQGIVNYWCQAFE